MLKNSLESFQVHRIRLQLVPLFKNKDISVEK